jgi:hypothetical protein
MQQHRNIRSGISKIAAMLGLISVATPLYQASAADVSVGAGVRTSLVSDKDAGTDFSLNSARIYLSGKASDQIGFMFNTEYDGEQIKPIDAVAQIAFSDQFNIWAGRFLAPTDRANLYGPYYSSHWGVYTDGVQDGYASMTTGRSDGVAYWGQFDKVKLSAGVFDVPSTKSKLVSGKYVTDSGSEAMYAARAQVDLWDPEGGYYLNGTYYGDKDLLAFGLSTNVIGSDTSYSFDALMEKKLPNAGVVTLEGEYAKYEGFSGGYPNTGKKTDGYYVLAAYLFPAKVGPGKFQVLAKHASADYKTMSDSQETNEIDLNYILKQFNARVSAFYIKSDMDVGADSTKYGLGLQIQM